MATVVRRAIVRALAAGLLGSCLVLQPLAVPAQAAVGQPLDSKQCIPPQDAAQNLRPPQDSWANKRLNPEQVWARNDARQRPVRGAGIKVAVIDTGAQIGVSPVLSLPPEASGQTSEMLPRWDMYDFIGDDQDIVNRGFDCSHGTAVVGYINGQQVGGWNMGGMAPAAQVTVLRALKSTQGNESQEPMVQAVTWAIDNKYDIINISQSGGDHQGLRKEIARAIQAGIVVVAAAGNGGRGSGPSYPAAYPGVIAVGMTTRGGAAASLSQSDPRMEVTVAAPGEKVTLLRWSHPQTGRPPADYFNEGRQGWNEGDGTSYATPMVSGVVALMLQHSRAEGKNLTPAEVKKRLQQTADRPPGAVPDSQLGYGTVNPMGAVFGPFPKSGSRAPEPEPTLGGPLPVSPPRDLGPALVSVGIGVAALLLVVTGLVVSEAIPAMRRRKFRPAQPDKK